MAKIIDMEQRRKELGEKGERFLDIELRKQRAYRDGLECCYAEFYVNVPVRFAIPPALNPDEEIPEKDFTTVGEYMDAWGGNQVILTEIEDNDLNWRDWIEDANIPEIRATKITDFSFA